MINAQKILVIAPHADDVELGCGATVAKLIEEGKSVHYAVFSFAQESVPKEFPKDILKTELIASVKKLGIPETNLIQYNYRVRYFSYNRQEILEDLVKLKRELNPDLVIIPDTDDVHQDHHVIARESIRAFKNCSILGYELPWNNFHFSPNFFVKVSKDNLDTKTDAVNCYVSQSHRKYINEDLIRGQAKMRGVQVLTSYAEAFHAIRLIY